MSSTDRRADFARSYDHAASIVAGVRPEQLAEPTPCPEYDVDTLVSHVVGAAWRAAALGRGEQPADVEFPHIDLAEAPSELRRAGQASTEAWSDDSRLAATITMPWGEEYDGVTLVDMYLTELCAHAWDVARASGQLAALDPTLAPVALEAAQSMLKPFYRDLAGPGSPFGQQVDAPEDADDWERFAAFMGRSPR